MLGGVYHTYYLGFRFLRGRAICFSSYDFLSDLSKKESIVKDEKLQASPCQRKDLIDWGLAWCGWNAQMTVCKEH